MLDVPAHPAPFPRLAPAFAQVMRQKAETAIGARFDIHSLRKMAEDRRKSMNARQKEAMSPKGDRLSRRLSQMQRPSTAHPALQSKRSSMSGPVRATSASTVSEGGGARPLTTTKREAAGVGGGAPRANEDTIEEFYR